MPRFSDRPELSADPRRVRSSGTRILALRQHTDDHPMAMFFIIVAAAFAAAALLSPSRAAIASLRVDSVQSSSAPGKTSRLAASEVEIACRGQAWGAESAACLAVIAKESGRGEKTTIRLIAAADPLSTMPSVFQ